MPAHKASPVQLSAEREREPNDLVWAHSTPHKPARIALLTGTNETPLPLCMRPSGNVGDAIGKPGRGNREFEIGGRAAVAEYGRTDVGKGKRVLGALEVHFVRAQTADLVSRFGTVEVSFIHAGAR